MPGKSLFSIWTLVGVLACLFVMSLFAPKAWETMRDKPLARMKGRRAQAAASVVLAAAKLPSPELPVRPTKEPVIAPEPTLVTRPVVDVNPEPTLASNPPPIDVELDRTPVEPEAAYDPPAMPTELPAELKTPRPTSPPVIASINDDDEIRRPIAWPRPESLLAQLNELTSEPRLADWARRAAEAAEAITALETHHDAQAPLLFDHLRKLSGEAAHLSHKLDPLGARIDLKRAEYALTRRVDIWEQVYSAATSQKATYPAVVEPRRLSDSLTKIEAAMRGRTGASDWRNYLLLDEAWKLTKRGGLNETQRRDVARSVLSRLESPGLSDTQQAYFRKPEFAALASELRMWAYEPVDQVKLLADLERYESDRRRDPAAHVAQSYQSLRWSKEAELAALAERIDTHYRNANLRFAVSGQLINRMLPAIKPTAEDVQETIAGTNVVGRSETETRLWVKLVPDRLRIRLGLEANGVVASETSASKGPATFHQDGLSRYTARKQLVIDRRGMKVWRSEAEADSETYMRGLDTEFDGLPIIGPFVRNIAQQKQQEMMGQAKWEMDGHIADKASERLDQEVHKRLHEAEREFQTRVLDPLTKLKLQPTAVGMETTAERFIVRYRVAGEQQLAAHTPRPQAPGDSWLSVQIHQSAINNAIEQLHFDGRQTTVTELIQDLAKTLGQPAPKVSDDLPTDVTLKFAPSDAVRVQCDDGKFVLVIRLAELNAGKGSRWKNFEVRAPLAPQANGLDAQLLRDDTIELSGERLSLRDQVALRGIFSRVISKNKPISLVPDKFRADPRLKILTVQQFVVDDGWVSLAFSPRRAPQQAGRPATKTGSR